MAASNPPERELRELLFLQQLSVAAASTMGRDELLALVIKETNGAMDADVCALYLYDRDRNGLVLTATNGLNQAAVGRVVMRLGQGVTGAVAAGRHALAVAEVSHDPRFKWIEGVDEERFTSMLSVPIEAGPRMVGVLNVQTVERRDFRQDEMAFLSAIAGAIAGVLERTELQHQLEGQLAEIRLSQTVHERFTKLVLDGAGLSNILEAIASLAAGAVGIYDPLGFRLEHGAGTGLRARRVPIPAQLFDAADPVETTSGRSHAVLTLAPVRAGSELIAVLALEGSLQGAPAGRRRALEHGATVVALELLKERAAAEVERRLRGDLLEGLLTMSSDPADITRLAVGAERLGYRIPDRSWLVILEPDDPVSAEVMQSHPIQERLQRDVERLCRTRAPGAMVVPRASALVVVLPEEFSGADAPPGRLTVTEVEAVARSLLELAHGLDRRLSVSAGVGGLAAAPPELARSHEEARQALRLVRRGGGRRVLTSYRSLGALRLLLEVRDPQVLRRFVEESMGPVIAYEERHRTPLIATLEALSNQGWNQRAAARTLGIHINSLTYRVQRAEALLGVSLDDPEARVVLGVALRARSLIAG
ncbi:MAG: helix-turn-helix domain-containing protein [Candidatus Dormibacteria bacterium]